MRPLEYVNSVSRLALCHMVDFSVENYHKVTFFFLAATPIVALIIHFMAEGYR
jgi:hypothetical protein